MHHQYVNVLVNSEVVLVLVNGCVLENWIEHGLFGFWLTIMPCLSSLMWQCGPFAPFMPSNTMTWIREAGVASCLFALHYGWSSFLFLLFSFEYLFYSSFLYTMTLIRLFTSGLSAYN